VRHVIGAEIVGWDIGGVNTKVARVVDGRIAAARCRPFELQRAPEALVPLLQTLANEAGATASAAHAVTMTAELSQMFRTKREGVGFVLTAIETAFPSSPISVFTSGGGFLDPTAARRDPIAVAAANWSATSRVVAMSHRDAVVIDIGTTTTDIIPIVGGVVVAAGRTDPERLVSGELVYSGVLRTPVEAIASHVPLGGGMAGVSAEGFALAGDVHVWRGDLAESDYTVATPDGRPVSREWCGERLARVVCGDRELVDEPAVSRIADALFAAQVDRISDAIRRVVSAQPSLRVAVVTGLGAFLGEAAARAACLDVVPLASELGEAAARCAPASAVALLLGSACTRTASHVDIVVKLGGGVLADREQFDAAIAMISATARDERLVVVPGGGPFADAVRAVDRDQSLSNSTAHWMAIRAMDQYADLIVEKLPDGVLVCDERAIAAAHESGQIPVLAPYRWLRDADPLPHSWDVTSDSLAAWIAGALGAQRLMLIKPSGATGRTVDPHFEKALPPGVDVRIVAPDRLGRRT